MVRLCFSFLCVCDLTPFLPFLMISKSWNCASIRTDVRTGKEVVVIQTRDPFSYSMLVDALIVKAAPHPNVIECLGVFVSGAEFWIVKEYLKESCLTDCLEAFDTVRMSESQMALVCREVLHHHIITSSSHSSSLLSFFP